MKKLLKILGVIVGVLVLLFIVVVAVATYFIDTNEYQQKIEATVKEKTGRELSIKGDMSLSFFPWIGMTMGETTLGNAPGFGNEPFASFDQVDIKVKLLPLFSRQVETRTILLDGMRLNLVKNKQGVTNWQDLQKSKPEEPKQDSNDARGGGLDKLTINGVEIKDASVSWRDEQAGSGFTISNLQLETGEIDRNKPVDMNLDFDFKDNKAKKAWHFGMGGRVLADMENDKASLSDLELSIANIKLKGDVQVTQLAHAPQISAKLASNEFSPRETMATMAIEPPATSDKNVLQKARFSFIVAANPDKVDLGQLQMVLDDTSIKGHVNVRNLSAPVITSKLDVDQINIDRYLPMETEKSAGTASTTKSDEIELPSDMLRELKVKANVNIGKMTAMNLRSNNIKVGFNANNGVLRFYPATANLYEGSYSGDLKIDVRGKALKVSMNEKLSGIQASPLFKDLIEKDWIGGTGDLSAKLTTQGNTMTALRSGLNGNVALSFLDGAIKGVNIPLKIRQASALIKGEAAPASEPNETRFASLTATAKVTNGVLDNRDMKMDTPIALITGEGQVDLGQESMDYLLKASVTEKLSELKSDHMKKLAGRTIPVRVKGPFDSLDYKVEVSEAVKEQVKEKAKEKLQEKIDEKVGDKLKDKLDDKFKNIFNR